jgi:hypothetical protein
MDVSVGLSMISPFYNISAFQISAKKDFSNEERKIEFELDRLNTALKNVSIKYRYFTFLITLKTVQMLLCILHYIFHFRKQTLWFHEASFICSSCF